jgi:hypothetical protein
MSQTKYPKVTIRSRNPDLPPTGSNTIVELDGKPLPMATYVKCEFHARRVTKVLIEMYAHVEIDTLGELSTQVVELKRNDRTKK